MYIDNDRVVVGLCSNNIRRRPTYAVARWDAPGAAPLLYSLVPVPL